jgi:AAA domain
MADEQHGAESAQADTEKWRARWGLHTPSSLHARVRELAGSRWLVQGLLPSRSVGLLVGDSGLGKSPLVYQLGMCVAAGIPFLGRKTQQGRVLLTDFENGLGDASELMERIRGHLGLSCGPSDFLFWSLNDCLPRYGQGVHTLLDMLKDVRPALAIIDALGSFRPEAEEKNSAATRTLQEFRTLTNEFGMTALGIHHRRKLSRRAEESAGPLEHANLRRWFEDARGASTLINGSDMRLGVDEPDLSAVKKDDVALVLRGFGRIKGEVGPLFIARDCGEDGDPQGYRLLTGPELLFNAEQQAAFEKLPSEFGFKDAKLMYGRADQPTTNWLRRLTDLGLVERYGRGRYRTLEPDSCTGNNGARRVIG